MAKKKKKKVSSDKRKKAFGIVLFLFALLILVSLVTHNGLDDARLSGEIDNHIDPFKIQYNNQAGLLGVIFAFYLLKTIGWLAFFLPMGLILLSARMFSSKIGSALELNSFLLFTISLVGTMIYNIHIVLERTLDLKMNTVGGIVSDKLTWFSFKLFGETGSYIILGGAVIVLLVLYTSITPLFSVKISFPRFSLIFRIFASLFSFMKKIFSFNWISSVFQKNNTGESGFSTDENEYDQEEETEDNFSQDKPLSASSASYDSAPEKHRLKLKDSPTGSKQLQLKSMEYSYPQLDLLNDAPPEVSSIPEEELDFTARMLRETLETFGVSIEGRIDKYPGPVITRFEFKPGSGVKVNQVINLADDLALALKAKRIRIIAPIPGKAAVGVEIPNPNPQMVYLREILESDEFKNPSLKLPLALGKTTSGKPFVIDLTKLPHLLIAGATGAGKSVCMNVLITSLLYSLHPYQVRFIMVDPKMLELSVYSGIPHLGRPVVTNPRRAEKVFTDAVAEMESRYKKLADASVRNIHDYNSKQTEDEDKLPYIVIFVDELADLMMSSTSSKTELLITRLAQMARAVGIHLVLATQRPSVDVITGLIKANFPARIAFQVSSKVDSRTIIDGNGAEKLLGLGDMLFLATGQPEAMRVHGAYLSNDETDSVVEFINDQGLEMLKLDSISQSTGEVSEAEIDFGDPLFREACEVVVRQKQGSVSLLQRRLGIGYQRAARMIDKLEQAGIVSSFDGSKAREVLVDEAYLATLFSNPNTMEVSESSNS